MACRIVRSAFLALLLSMQASQVSAQTPQLTALDYFEIQQLVAKYARAIDTCSNNGYDYADLFAEDGYFAPEVNGKVGNKAQGRERLAEISGGGSRGCKNVGWIRQGVKHLYVNHIIEPTAEGAKGSVDMLMIGLGGDPYKIHHEGYYEDTYVKTPKGWRFASRVHHVPEGGTAGQAPAGRGGQQGQSAPAAPPAPPADR
jgi:hypothetical protein